MAVQKMGKWKFTDKELREQLDRSARLGADERARPASKLEFSRDGKRITLHFPDKFVLGFPSSLIKELGNATPAQVRSGRLTDSGDAIHWDDLDAHYTVMGLLLGRFGSREWMREIAKKGGSKTSLAKRTAARINGAKGGRPRAGTSAASHKAAPAPKHAIRRGIGNKG
jgi:hypothetical protein